MSNNDNSIPPDDDDDSSIEDFYDDQLFDQEQDVNARLDKKYDKDNEDFDKKFRKKFKHKSEDESTTEGVMDFSTSKELYRMQAKGFLDEFNGIISTGKEANVYYATSKNLAATHNISKLAVKIFRTRTLDFKKIKLYIEGDIRFQKSGKKSHQIIQTWALKEYKNLLRAFEHGLSVPRPFLVKRNILIMELLEENNRPAPQLRNCKDLTNDEIQLIYEDIFRQVSLLWTKAKLVHGDLSAYNILYANNKSYIIDMGQAVLTEHIHADLLLLRDIENLLYYFSDFDITIQSPEELFEQITGRVPDMDQLKLKLVVYHG